MASPTGSQLWNAATGTTSTQPAATAAVPPSSGGSPSGAALWNAANGGTPAPAAASPQHHGSLLGNLVNDVETSLRGIGPGIVHTVEHPVRLAEQVGHQYSQYYGPLFQGHFGEFAHNVEQHPLQIGMDLLTLATLGGGAVAQVGRLADKAGVISSESRLATLSHATPLTVPDLAKQLGQPGEDLLTGLSSTNPVTRLRQVGMNKLLNAARPDIPLVGSEARLARAVVKGAVTPGQSLALKAAPLERAFGRLNKTEQAVWHLKMQHLDPEGWTKLLADGAVKDPKGTEALMTSKLAEKKLNDLYRHPMQSKRLMAALQEGHLAADLLTADKVERGIISETSAAERPFLAQRVLHGAKVGPLMEDLSPALLGQTAAPLRGFVDQPGHSIPELAQRLNEQGAAAGLPDELRQPSYVPHSAGVSKKPSQSWRPGANPPMRPGSTRMNEATLLHKGMLNLHRNSLADEMRLHGRFVQRTDISGALAQLAAKEPETGLPNGYRFLKTTTGQASAKYTEQAAGPLRAELESKPSLLDRFTTQAKDLPDEQYAKDAEGHRLIIPDHVANSLAREARPTRNWINSQLFQKPTTIWKHMILGLRPAYMVNIIASQHILGALQMAGGTRGVVAYFNHLLPGARLGKLKDATIEDVMPEQAMASFSHSTGLTGARGVAGRAYQGVMPATMKVENWLRRLMIEGWAKSSPQVVHAMKVNGGDINLALRDIAKSDPHVLHEISSRVDHAQGNYRIYSPAEQKIRQFIPFYGWDKHIIQSTYRILAERPALANAGLNIGRQGAELNQAQFGNLPPYLQGIIGVGTLPSTIGAGTPGTTTPVLASKAFEPFSTVADLASLAGALVHGKPGTGNDQISNVNPFITAAVQELTGKNLLTGAPLKGNIPGGLLGGVTLRTAADLPQARLLEQIANWHPTGQSKTPVGSRDWLTQLLALAGAPVKKIDLPQAHSLAAKKIG